MNLDGLLCELPCGRCRGRSRDRDLNSPIQSLHKLRYSEDTGPCDLSRLQGHSEKIRRDRRYSRATHDSGAQPVASFSLKLKEQVSPTVVSPTHTLQIPALSRASLGKVSRHINVVLCDNFPSAAPSVRWTESAARHFQQRLHSIDGRFFLQPFFIVRFHARKFVDLATTISDFDEVLSGNWDGIPEVFFYMVEGLADVKKKAANWPRPLRNETGK